jgi:hypothetical protein
MNAASVLLLVTAVGLLLSSSCSSDSTPPASTGPAGGLVVGDADAHCGSPAAPVATDPAACMTPEAPEAAAGAGGAAAGTSTASAGGTADCNAEHDAQYGDTLYNDSGNDDDCKYFASWASTPIRLNEDVTLTVEAHDLTTTDPLEPLSDGEIPLSRVEVYQPCKPTRRAPAQDYVAKFKETAPGTFSGGPLRFDQSGRWVVRFHFYEQCLDSESSPHGHIAFFVDVP